MVTKNAEQELEEVRLAIGANDGEPLLDAIHRYTFAVQLGCALKLEQHIQQRAVDAAADGGLTADAIHQNMGLQIGATLLRDGIPTAVYGDNAQPDAIERWRAEQVQAIKDGWLGPVFDQWWSEAMGGVPADNAKARFRQLLEEHEPGKEHRRFNPEGMVIPASSLWFTFPDIRMPSFEVMENVQVLDGRPVFTPDGVHDADEAPRGCPTPPGGVPSPCEPMASEPERCVYGDHPMPSVSPEGAMSDDVDGDPDDPDAQ